MLKRRIAMLAAATIIVGVGVVAPAALAQSPCRDHDESIAHLEKQFGEKPIARGLINSGKIMVEVLKSESGSWTIITTNTQGLTCILASGKAWTDVQIIPVTGEGV